MRFRQPATVAARGARAQAQRWPVWPPALSEAWRWLNDASTTTVYPRADRPFAGGGSHPPSVAATRPPVKRGPTWEVAPIEEPCDPRTVHRRRQDRSGATRRQAGRAGCAQAAAGSRSRLTARSRLQGRQRHHTDTAGNANTDAGNLYPTSVEIGSQPLYLCCYAFYQDFCPPGVSSQ